MIHASRRILIVILIALIMLSAGFVLTRAVGGKNDKTSFSITSGTSLRIESSLARISIKGTDGSTINVVSKNAKNLKTSENGSVISIKQKAAPLSRGLLEIEVPKKMLSALDIESKTGDVAISGFEAESISAKTVTGAIRISDMKARVISATLTTGSIDIESSESDALSVSLITGNTDIESSAFGSIAASLITGDLDIENTAFEKVEASAVTGDISIDADQSDLTVSYNKYKTLGSVEIFGSRMEKSEDTLTFGSGSKTIDAEINIGDIEIH